MTIDGGTGPPQILLWLLSIAKVDDTEVPKIEEGGEEGARVGIGYIVWFMTNDGRRGSSDRWHGRRGSELVIANNSLFFLMVRVECER